MIILGVDPGTIRLGYGLINVVRGNKFQILASGVIAPAPKKPIFERLGQILQKLEEIFLLHKPNIVSLEKSFYGTNAKTAISLGEARGVVLSLAGKYESDFQEFSPLSVKQSITGSGKADKEQVQKMVRMILNYDKDFKSADESDALAIALCCYYRVASRNN